MEAIQEHGPSRLEHLNKNVVVNVADEMSHLVVSQIESMELCLKVSREPSELFLI